MNNVYYYLSKPFKDNINFLLLFFLLTSSFSIYDWTIRGYYYYTLYLLLHSILVSYVFVLPIGCLKGRINIVYKCILLIFSLAIFVFNSFCYIRLQSIFYPDIVAVIAGTNTQESVEYLESSVSLGYVVSAILLLALFFFMYYLVSRMKSHIGNKIKITGMVLILVGILMTVHNPSIYKDGLLGELQTFFQISKVPDLRMYATNPSLVSVENDKPKNIVLIIGESYTKSHSSLYGYGKNTNPHLSSLRDEQMLFVFDSVRSAMINTTKSFQTLMSTYKPEMENSCNWYECTTLPEVVKLAGYNTYWVSNQSRYGLYDNVVGSYSELCDSSLFTGDMYSGVRRCNYDEEIFPILSPLLKDTVANNFYIVHLMGSHISFYQRYPSSFGQFKEDEYMDYPENQRKTLADYDNSLLYNDSVVYGIMNLYSDKEAIILYFSDHGIDLFETSDTYFGHAIASNPLSVDVGKNIPFMIYATSKYQEKFKDKMNQIRKNIHRRYRTDDVIYTVMDIIGVHFRDNNDVERYSLFSDRKN